MEKMPYKLKQKVKKLNRNIQESMAIQDEITLELEKYGIDGVDIFTANSDLPIDKQTEALAYILNGEVPIENIDWAMDMIEKIFLIHAKESEE
ncbi:hypothetical protein [Vagococcus fluvialis]|uniref:hypothetical protein n=1 Tax=Vagococcus fluvialis TaxID=2738 RepID=UPI001D09B0A9|nr:hypothetical protein [Vagococcus fluvialis]UDM72711.1 hypothetical protein K5L00_15100 [Vagococcus fluvialis]UDM78434.1 hypothetical protein K5K98_14435 [Vagococcus fluvialis]UDM83986.1 hypothetical protein K5K96_15125 [Vagococcus fluvialis]